MAQIVSSLLPKCYRAASRHEHSGLVEELESIAKEKGVATVTTPNFAVEVITLPVSEVESALRFYVDQDRLYARR